MEELYAEQKSTRTSPSIFAYIDFFQSKWFVFSLFVAIPLIIGFGSTLLHYWGVGAWDWTLFTRDFVIFFTGLSSASLITRCFKFKAKFLNTSISFLINEYVAIFFGGSYLASHFLLIFYRNQALILVFFLLGAILAFVLSFLMLFSFTTIGSPWYFIVPLIQPTVGITLFAYFSGQITPDFFLQAMIFFCACAAIFAIPYSYGMFSVSTIYSKPLGKGGYKFVRAFILSLMTENNDDEVEVFFDEVGVKRDVQINYLALRVPGQEGLKGLFLTPHIHFGPFKTAGSAALADKLYETFAEIPGTTIFHTACTHGENLTRHGQIDKIKRHIQENLAKLEFSSDPVPQFSRTYYGKARIMGTNFGQMPFIITTRHPLPSDDIEPALLEAVTKLAIEQSFSSPMFVDAHNAIVGDEIRVTNDSPEGEEILQACREFMEQIALQPPPRGELLYGVTRDPMAEFSYQDGVGGGGLVLHVFQIGNQRTAIVHIDGNNAVLDYRSRVVNLLESKGFDRIEVTTSDTHVVARVLSGRGYNPIGTKIPINVILAKIDHMVEAAVENLEPVEWASFTSTIPQLKIWGSQEYFDNIIIPTIQRCLTVSKFMLTVGLILPLFFSFLLLAVFFGINPNPFD
ncbi:MAG TPA: DUF2070 family protein [Candidatus Lokiarchaeia archaeon]|nr:DUF2070 family protein [Candidatus Lokiarchaeia archaeon]